MSQAVSIWLLILLALVAANLPFFTERLLGLLPLGSGKSLAVCLAELLLMYFVVGGFGLWLEHRAGQIAAQGWEFYAVTGSLFATLAVPGFVWRYLVPRSRGRVAADSAAE
ncbi:MAG: DUF2818 family protein [Burkholderiaceae bacterium]